MSDINGSGDVDALTTIITCLKKMSSDEQKRTLYAVATFLDIDFSSIRATQGSSYPQSAASQAPKVSSHFSEDRSISPKDFLRDKMPRTDVERVACLAYYLTHYRETAHFKTLDISSLNIEAAQPKFSNASIAVDNAAKAGLIVQATKGNKQLSSTGETFVQLLPDRDAAKAGIATLRPKKRGKKTPSKKTESS